MLFAQKKICNNQFPIVITPPVSPTQAHTKIQSKQGINVKYQQHGIALLSERALNRNVLLLAKFLCQSNKKPNRVQYRAKAPDQSKQN